MSLATSVKISKRWHASLGTIKYRKVSTFDLVNLVNDPRGQQKFHCAVHPLGLSQILQILKYNFAIVTAPLADNIFNLDLCR